MKLRIWGAPLLSATLLFCPGVALAAAAQVLFSLNRVEIVRSGQTLPAPRGTAVEVGDTFNTGPTGYAQLRFKDGALLVLRPGSSINIEEFSLPQPAAIPAQSTATTIAPSSDPSLAATGGRSVLRLLRGAFRTITGTIGKGNNDLYRVATPAATIGIRGTDYSAAICSGSCGAQKDGLYVGVSNGEIVLNNDIGEIVLNNNEYAYVRDNNTPPEQELAPPEALETPIAAEEGGDSEDKAEEPGATADAGSSDSSSPPPESTDSAGAGDNVAIENKDPETRFELQPGQRRSISGSLSFGTGAPQPAVAAFTDVDDKIEVAVTTVGELLKFTTGTTSLPEVYDLGTSQNQNPGLDDVTGLRWGRWSGGMATVNGQSLDLSMQSLHWIYGEQGATAPVLPVEGSLTYSLVGNTNPTDQAGNVGYLGSAQFSACFSCTNAQSGLGTVWSVLDIGIGGQVWTASGSGGITADTALFNGTYSSVSVNGTSGGSGNFAGFFTDNAASAGLSYTLESSGSTVSGTAAFGNPTVPFNSAQ